jgi:hypothetical protein
MKELETLFCTYDQALALKELGYDEPCFGRFMKESNNLLIAHTEKYFMSGIDRKEFFTQAPLKSQVFQWFRDKHKLYAEIDLDSYQEPYSLKVTIKKMDATNTYVEEEFYPYANGIGDIDNDKYEEAEEACIDKLIELIKNK